MEKKDKKRDPMPPPDATPKEIGEFWDTHSLADYWDETHEVEFQVNLKSEQNQTQYDETKPDLPATTEDGVDAALEVVSEDTTDTEIDTIADLVSSLNLPIWIARNASKAFRQLCSAAVEWPAAFFKGKASERHAISAANTKITEAVTDQIIQQINVPPEYAQIAIRKQLEKIIGEQINLDRISAIAANELKNEQSDNLTNQGMNEPNKEQSANSSNQEANGGEEKTISDVWLNIFETEARPQSTEEGQLLFGRILAGEIGNPGLYSIRTLKTLGELDQDAAVLFKNLCSLCVVLGHLPSKYIRDARVCFLDEKLGKQTLDKYGLGNDRLNILEEYGLIRSSFYYSEFPYHVCIVNENNEAAIPFRHQGQDWILVPLSEQTKCQDFKLSGIAFSKIGCELFYIVDQDPIPEYTEDLKKFLAEQNLRMVKIPTR